MVKQQWKDGEGTKIWRHNTHSDESRYNNLKELDHNGNQSGQAHLKYKAMLESWTNREFKEAISH